MNAPKRMASPAVLLNHTSWWKKWALFFVITTGALYALPNLYGEDPALQVSPQKTLLITTEVVSQLEQTLKQAHIAYHRLTWNGDRLLVRFANTEDQLKAKDQLSKALGDPYVLALNLAPAAPPWLSSLNASPMFLGLDLRGGVHFLMDVDLDSAVKQHYERQEAELKTALRMAKLRYKQVMADESGIQIALQNPQQHLNFEALLAEQFEQLLIQKDQGLPQGQYRLALAPSALADLNTYAVKQNITTLRNRVNELGVAEPIIQRQGERRIVVELPGVQDTARAKEILGATATLEFRLADDKNDAVLAQRRGIAPAGTKLYTFRDGRPILLKRSVIVTGDNVINAKSSIDPQNGSPMVSVTLDGSGGNRMLKTTKQNIGNRMAVVFMENKMDTKTIDGETIKTRRLEQNVINAAVIRDQFANRFQITGLDSAREARDLALLLRAGALAAPMDIVEERTVGPSMGQANIDQGFYSVIIGFVLVLIFMVWRYRAFGLIADMALTLNLVLMVAVLSLLQATLTLPGIAGIVLTVGMAVDANVLIFERIKEEIRHGSAIQQAIHAGYEKAFMTIADANITTLLAALVLFIFGTGPIKGFAITLAIGILTSMFTAILGTRVVVNALYGHKPGGQKVEKLSL